MTSEILTDSMVQNIGTEIGDSITMVLPVAIGLFATMTGIYLIVKLIRRFTGTR